MKRVEWTAMPSWQKMGWNNWLTFEGGGVPFGSPLV